MAFNYFNEPGRKFQYLCTYNLREPKYLPAFEEFHSAEHTESQVVYETRRSHQSTFTSLKNLPTLAAGKVNWSEGVILFTLNESGIFFTFQLCYVRVGIQCGMLLCRVLGHLYNYPFYYKCKHDYVKLENITLLIHKLSCNPNFK